jgi:RNA-directed DNA polymerase
MTRQYQIPKQAVEEAWKRVKANKGAEGVDGQTIRKFEAESENNLYKIWNRMTSGSYFPPAVRAVEIPKSSGEVRILGVPTVADRVAQTVTKMYLEPLVEPKFHKDSYGYRPGRSQHQAIAQAKQRCWRYDWVLEIDIKGFFDNIDHDLMMELVRGYTQEKWVLLYIERWLKADMQRSSGDLEKREKGSPQGSVISPLLSNIFLHHAFDSWMKETNPETPFERYADDQIVHCKTLEQAEVMKRKIIERLKEWKLDVNQEKTRIVYCKDSGRLGDHEKIEFTFLGYTFRPRRAKNRKTKEIFSSFQPAISNEAKDRIRKEIQAWQIHKRTGQTLAEIGTDINEEVRGWFNYYAKFYPSAMYVLFDYLEDRLIGWAVRKYKRLKASTHWGRELIERIRARQPNLLAHWAWCQKRLLSEGAV